VGRFAGIAHRQGAHLGEHLAGRDLSSGLPGQLVEVDVTAALAR
jgi:predicted heme/steroid binding protein